MRILTFIILGVAVLVLTNGQPQINNDPIVKTAQGLLRGSILTSRKGRPIYSFRGVRFAQPPVGKLRFKAPVPPEVWTGVRNATEDGFVCPQSEKAVFHLPQSEDCLFLNVYSTKLPEGRKNPNRPVVVYFHTGAFFFYTGSSAVHGPQYLMDQDIVLVVTNYRLGALGFLSTGDGVLPGNYGLKDQVETLRWVKQNIAAFGGNPNSVTITGCSAGGVSVWYHMVSPMSRGLFHKGISLSPGVNTYWDLRNKPLEQAKKQAALLNCSSETSHQIADCLRKKDAQDFISTFHKLLGWRSLPLLQYTAVIEKDNGEERFLVESPMKTTLEGNFTQIPWMTGTTRDEFDDWAYFILRNSTVVDDLNTNFDKIAPIVLEYEQGTEKSHQFTQDIKSFYFHNKPITNDSIAGLGHVFSDALIRYGHYLTAKEVAKISKEPVYSFLFEYEGRYSHHQSNNSVTNTPKGVIHHDDLIYLFYISTLFPEFTEQDPESEMVEKLTTLWANFIYTGNPTPSPSKLLDNVTWQRMTPENLAYISIGSELKMKARMFQDRMDFWEKNFPAKP